MANRFWVGGTGTWDASDTTHWAATTGGAGGQSVPGSSDNVIFDGSSGGGTVTVSHASNSIVSLTMGAFTGTLDFATNDNDITMQYFAGSGAGARTLNMGDGTWTITSSTIAPLWDIGVATNLTLNCNGSTINFSATAPTVNNTFKGGGKTYNILTIPAATTGTMTSFNGSNTFATLNITLPRNLNFSDTTGSSLTQTITNAFNWTGGSASNLSTIIGGTNAGYGGGTIVATGGGTIDWAVISNLNFTTGTVTASNSYDGKSTSGITITAPAGGARVIGG